jgi:hypothetical protein
MIPFTFDYVIPGDVFPDETVLCMRCGTQIMGISYIEMPKINDPKQMVNVAHKKRFFNYRIMPVVLSRGGKKGITFVLSCQDCLKEIVPEDNSSQIVNQIVKAMEAEAKWAGMPEASIEGIRNQYADAKILRKLAPQEVMENRILEDA